MKVLEKNDKDVLLRLLAERGIAFDHKGIAHKHNAVQQGQKLPPFKFNLCTADIRPEGKLRKEDISLIGTILLKYLKLHAGWEEVGLSGIPRVAEPLVEELQSAAYETCGVSLPRAIILKTETGFVGYRIRGHISPLCLWGVDDLIQYGLTKLPALNAWEDFGFRVRNMLVVLDYERGGPDMLLREHYVNVHALATVREVVSFAEHHNLWSDEQVATVRAYLSSSS